MELEVYYEFSDQSEADSLPVKEALTVVFVDLSDSGMISGSWTVRITGRL